MARDFYELGLSSEFTSNYTELNKGNKIKLFQWQKEVLNIGNTNSDNY